MSLEVALLSRRPARIEREMVPDLRNRRIRILVRPHGIEGLLSPSGNAVVIAIAFMTVGSVICPFQLGEIHVPTRNVLNREILFPEALGRCGYR